MGKNVVRCNSWPLIRSVYALVAVWLTHATLLQLFEHDNHARGMTVHEFSDPESAWAHMTMHDRYDSVPSALSYSMVHLTGDFPFTRYRIASQVVLYIGIVLGM